MNDPIDAESAEKEYWDACEFAAVCAEMLRKHETDKTNKNSSNMAVFWRRNLDKAVKAMNEKSEKRKEC